MDVHKGEEWLHNMRTLPQLSRASGVAGVPLSYSDFIERLFSPDWYLARYPDVACSRMTPFYHYKKHGLLENRSPHPLFDAEWYVEHYDDVRANGTPAILHFLEHGGREWRRPNRWVDIDVYYSEFREETLRQPHNTILEDFLASEDRLAAFQFFSQTHYQSSVPDSAGLSANACLTDFLSRGIMTGATPHYLLDTSSLCTSSDLAGRLDQFNSLFIVSNETFEWAPSDTFSPGFFLRKYGACETHPIIQYLRGWRQHAYWPHPLFDPEFYSQQSGIADDIEPLGHYLQHGHKDDLWPNAFFDSKSYRRRFGHLVTDQQTEIGHYLEVGHLPWFEPSDWFGQRFYINRYGGMMPNNEPALVHFLHDSDISDKNPLPQVPFHDYTAGYSIPELVEEVRASVCKEPTTPLVSIIIPSYGQVEYTLRCILSVLNSRDQTPFEIIVIDDKSPDQSGDLLKKNLDNLPLFRVMLNTENLGFLKSCNRAAKEANGRYLCFLNNDTWVTPGWLDELVATFDRVPSAGIVGSKLLYPNGLLQEAGGIIWSDGSSANVGHLLDPQAPEFNYLRCVDYVSGAALMVQHSLWTDLNGFSEYLAPAYFEDVDLAMKCRAAGKKVLYQPLSTVVHFEGISNGRDTSRGVKKFQAVNQKKFIDQWQSALAGYGSGGDLDIRNVDRSATARILVFDAEVPTPDRDSGSVTAINYLKIMTESGYRVTFVPENLQLEGSYGRDLQRLGVEVIHAPHATSSREYVLEHGGSYDLFFLSRITAGGGLVSSLKEKFPNTPVIFDTVDIHHLRLRRQAELERDGPLLAQALECKSKELNAITRADVSIVVSEFEVEYLRNEIGPFSHAVLPLIYEDYMPQNDFDSRVDVAFVGSFMHPPNIDAVQWLVDEIWPIVRERDLGATLHIIGSDMPSSMSALAASDIKVVGFVEDLESYLEDIRMTIAPLRYGAGVKGKVGNSMRMGVPVVCSRMAVEGMDLTDGHNVLVAEDSHSFADQIARLYTDEPLWQSIAREGRQFVDKRFGLEVARKNLLRVVRSLITSSSIHCP